MHATVVAILGLAFALDGSVPPPDLQGIRAYTGPFRIASAFHKKAQFTNRDLSLTFKVTNGSGAALRGCLDGGGGLIYKNSTDPEGLLIIGPSIHPHCEREFDLQPGESFEWETTWLTTGLPLGEVRVVPWIDIWTGTADKVPWHCARVPAGALFLVVTEAGVVSGGQRPNNSFNPTVVPFTRLACARRVPVPPAG